MKKEFSFSENEETKIVKNFNREFFEHAKNNINRVINKWNISSITLIDSFSANIVFKCESRTLGKTVIKVGRNLKELSAESFALDHFSGKKLCKLYEIDQEAIMLIEECIEPGIVLRKESSLDKRLEVFADLFMSLHIEIGEDDKFSTYENWIDDITDYMSQKKEHDELYQAMRKAQRLFKSLSQVYNKKCLLHGDFHHDNILLDSNGSYRIIDPKGVIGDPIFDVPRFILNEFWFEPKTDELKERVTYLINKLSNMLQIPINILKECLYIETMMGTCWWIEDGPSSEEYQNLTQTVLFVEKILSS